MIDGDAMYDDKLLNDIARERFDCSRIPELFEGWRRKDENYYYLTDRTCIICRGTRYQAVTPYGDQWFLSPLYFEGFFEQFESLAEVEVYFRPKKI